MIEIKDLCKSYGKTRVYEHLSLKLRENVVTGIVGPSGCGKTTLLRILAGLESYESGEVTGLEGKKVSLVFQEDRLMPWLTVEENIAYVLEGCSPQEQEKRIHWALQLLKLEDYQKSRLQSLSGGMKRRVAIARSLVYEGSVVLWDEPFKGLDDTLKQEIFEKLKVYWREKKQTVVIVTHDQQFIRQLDEVIHLGNGPLG